MEFIGFNGDREFALSRLEACARWPKTETAESRVVSSETKECFSLPGSKSKNGTLHKPVADIVLLCYHVVISSLVPLPDCNLPLASRMLEDILLARPNSFIFLALHARMLQTQAKLEEAEKEYERAIEIQKDWRQLVHFCLWDVGIIQSMRGKFKEAADSYEILYQENKWSKSVCRLVFL